MLLHELAVITTSLRTSQAGNKRRSFVAMAMHEIIASGEIRHEIDLIIYSTMAAYNFVYQINLRFPPFALHALLWPQIRTVQQ